MHHLPPKWAQRLLTRFHPEDTLEEVEGDLEELYAFWLQKSGKFRADLRYCLSVLTVLPPFVRSRKKREYHQPSKFGNAMLRNYFTVAWRNLARQKGYSLIKVSGLAFGLACCLLISLYIQYELSYDSFHEKADRIYRVLDDVTRVTGARTQTATAGAIGPALANEFPEVEKVVRLKRASLLVGNKEMKFQEENAFFADSTVFDVFTFPLLKGNPHTALHAPLSVVLSAKTAEKYFGNNDPIGKTLVIDSNTELTVTGVLKEIPLNTHLPVDMLLSITIFNRTNPGFTENWSWPVTTYVQLNHKDKRNALEAKLSQFIQRHTSDTQLKKEDKHVLALQPLNDIYLNAEEIDKGRGSGTYTNLYLFAFIGSFILLIACVNFINLTTAQANKRAKEVGLRKVIGGTRLQLAQQFLAESILLCVCATLLAILGSYLFLPFFSGLINKPLTMAVLASPSAILMISGSVLVIGCISGGYPALLLSGFQPIKVLKGSFRETLHGRLFREGLITFQFIVSITLIIGTIIVFSQLRYMRDQNLGYNQDQILVLYFGDDDKVQAQVEFIKEKLGRSSGIAHISASSNIPGSQPGNVQTTIEDSRGIKHTADMNLIAVDYDFIPLYQLPLVAGRAFSRTFGTDSVRSYIINETAARQMGFKNPQELIGRPFSFSDKMGTVVGVVKDFHYVSLHKRIEPLVMRMRSKSLSYLSMQISTKELTTTLQDLEKRWREVAPHRPFDYFFLDAQFEQQYKADNDFGQIFGVSALIAIILACVGLFGLVSFTVQQRTKEIGVRKVLGASVASVMFLLSKDFIKLVVMAIIISSPLAWYFMNNWLQDFAYRIDIQWWVFALAGLFALVITVLTVSYQSIKAALVNPVKSLKNE